MKLGIMFTDVKSYSNDCMATVTVRPRLTKDAEKKLIEAGLTSIYIEIEDMKFTGKAFLKAGDNVDKEKAYKVARRKAIRSCWKWMKNKIVFELDRADKIADQRLNILASITTRILDSNDAIKRLI